MCLASHRSFGPSAIRCPRAPAVANARDPEFCDPSRGIRTSQQRVGISLVPETYRLAPKGVPGPRLAIRSFTTTPYVFADLARARAYIGLPPTKFNHFTIRLRPGADAANSSASLLPARLLPNRRQSSPM